MLKPREEYLIEYENKLITQFTNIFKSQGKNIFSIYIISGFYLLFVSGYIAKISLFGNDINIDVSNLRFFMPFVLFSLYLFVNYQTIRIAKSIHKIRVNTNEILNINENARPLTTDDIFYFSSGLSGLVLAFAKWQFSILVNQKFFAHYKKVALKKGIKKFVYLVLLFFNIGVIFILSLLSFIVILALYLLPLLIVLAEIFNSTNNPGSIINIKNTSAILLVVSSLATVASIFILLSMMLDDLIKNLKSEVETSMIDLRKTLVSRILIKVAEYITDSTIRF